MGSSENMMLKDQDVNQEELDKQPLKKESLNKEQQALLEGLQKAQKTINPMYFYDQKGSELFEEITNVEEYYPTRTETAILQQNAQEMASFVGENVVLIEPGAGSCTKVRSILDEIRPKAYIPQDVSAEFLKQAALELQESFEWLDVIPLVSDFAKPLEIPKKFESDPKCVFYPGSTIGNFEPENAIDFLQNMRQLVGNGGELIIGMDLHKGAAILEPAYNDAQKITQVFNLNMLTNLNNIFATEFDLSKFEHYAFYNVKFQRIEMHLRSLVEQEYEVFGHSISFLKGETIHTENSHKYTLKDIKSLAKTSGFNLEKTWLDDNKLFSVNFFRAVPD